MGWGQKTAFPQQSLHIVRSIEARTIATSTIAHSNIANRSNSPSQVDLVVIVTAVEPILGCAAEFATLVTQEQDLNQIEGIQQSPTESACILSVSGHHQ